MSEPTTPSPDRAADAERARTAWRHFAEKFVEFDERMTRGPWFARNCAARVRLNTGEISVATSRNHFSGPEHPEHAGGYVDSEGIAFLRNHAGTLARRYLAALDEADRLREDLRKMTDSRNKWQEWHGDQAGVLSDLREAGNAMRSMLGITLSPCDTPAGWAACSREAIAAWDALSPREGGALMVGGSDICRLCCGRGGAWIFGPCPRCNGTGYSDNKGDAVMALIQDIVEETRHDA